MLLVSTGNKPVDSVNHFALQVMVTEVLLVLTMLTKCYLSLLNVKLTVFT